MKSVILGACACGTPAVDITAMTSSGHVTSSVTSPIDSARPLSYRLPIVNNSSSAVVSEIFSVKNGHRRARRARQPSAGEVCEHALGRRLSGKFNQSINQFIRQLGYDNKANIINSGLVAGQKGS